MTTFRRFLGGGVAACAVAGAGRRRGALSRDGAVAAVVVGTLTVGGGGWWWGTALVGFFATSSALSGRGGRTRREADPAARGAERDAVQVVANGGVAAGLAAVATVAPPSARLVLFGGFVGAVAAAAADTWATELGRTSAVAPRLIVGGGRVPPGTSGGVTPLGSVASVAGAGLIAALAALGVAVGRAPGSWPALLWGSAVAGIAGSTVDSLLGATIQAAYRCPRCGLPTERPVHGCGTPTRLVRGHPAVTNDAVNAAATAVGAALGATFGWAAARSAQASDRGCGLAT